MRNWDKMKTRCLSTRISDKIERKKGVGKIIELFTECAQKEKKINAIHLLI